MAQAVAREDTAHASVTAETSDPSSAQTVRPLGVPPCDVGCEVRRLRLAAGWTQDELARRSATSQPAIALLESGRRMPMLSTLERLAAALGRDLVVTLPARDPAVSTVQHQDQVLDGMPTVPPDGVQSPLTEHPGSDRSTADEVVVA